MRFLLLATLMMVVDQLTKLWVLNNFALYESLELIPGFFNLTLVMNRGAAFGFLAGVDGAWRHYFFLVLGVVALVVLVVAWLRLRQAHHLYASALPMIAGGAVGNLIDRLRHGAVVEDLDR